MTTEMWITLGLLAVAIFLFITEWIRVDVVALGMVVLLMLSGVLTTNEALSGFSNPAVLTIAALFIVGGAVMQTGLAGAIGRRILHIAGENPNRLLVVIILAVALLSGFMSDTGTVAVLLPAIISLASTAKIAPSKLLIPLAYGALLGGANTLIGTTPNIIVSDLLHENGYAPFNFFSFTPLGLVLLIAGVLYMLFIGRRTLPDRKPLINLQRVETPGELADLYRLPEDLFQLRVRRGSSLIDQTLAEADLGQQFKITVVDIQKPQTSRRGVINLPGQRVPGATAARETKLQLDDLLIAKGEANDIAHAAAVLNLGVQPASPQDSAALVTQEVGIAEVLLPPRSSMIGKTITDVRFGTAFALTVLGIHRSQARESLPIGTTPLQMGDILLVQGRWDKILALRNRRRDFVVMGQPEEMVGAPTRSKAPIALLILLGMLSLMVGEVFPIATASMFAALLMILTGCLTIDDAYEAIDWKSIVLIAGMLPMSIALEKVGLVNLAAAELTLKLGSFGPTSVLAILFFTTAAFTQVLSNTATTVLLAPIALAAANNLAVQPYAYMMAIAVAASMAFASPVASPTNTLVMGAGSYRFGDYMKVGLPLIFVTLALSVLLLPFLFPY